jgi:pimeloyl-ACP methyl ester carboxylesterase
MGQGPPLVFTQGNGFTVECYREALLPAAERVTVHALNSRGHGGSDIPASLADWDGMLEDLAAYLRQTFGAPVLVGAHSMGATLSMRLAAEAPDLVAGLLLMEPNLLAGPRDPWPSATEGHSLEFANRARGRRDRWASRAEARAWLRERGIYKTWSDGPLDDFIASGMRGDDGGVRLACPPWLEGDGYATLPGPVIYRWAEGIRVPTVLIKAATSPVVHPHGVEALRGCIPVFTALTVKGGHAFPMEHPRDTGRAIAMAVDVLLRAGAGESAAS